jgi:hypothetical protein
METPLLKHILYQKLNAPNLNELDSVEVVTNALFDLGVFVCSQGNQQK